MSRNTSILTVQTLVYVNTLMLFLILQYLIQEFILYSRTRGFSDRLGNKYNFYITFSVFVTNRNVETFRFNGIPPKCKCNTVGKDTACGIYRTQARKHAIGPKPAGNNKRPLVDRIETKVKDIIKRMAFQNAVPCYFTSERERAYVCV